MKSRAKVGGKKGNPGYRTPSPFKYRKAIGVRQSIGRHNDIKIQNSGYDF